MPLLGIVFDFDGVIANTEPLHLRAYQEVLTGTTLTLDQETYYARYLGYDDVGVFTALGSDQGVSLEADQIRRLVETKAVRFASLLEGDHVLFPGAADCIERLASVAPLGIASGALHGEIEDLLSSTKLRGYFQTIVAADDVERSKPAPDSYRRAVELLVGDRDVVAPAHFVAIEDSQWGIQAAQAAGLACVAVTHSYPSQALSTADIVVSNLGDVRPALLEQLCPPLDEAGQPVR